MTQTRKRKVRVFVDGNLANHIHVTDNRDLVDQLDTVINRNTRKQKGYVKDFETDGANQIIAIHLCNRVEFKKPGKSKYKGWTSPFKYEAPKPRCPTVRLRGSL
jgi:hypothetical protein